MDGNTRPSICNAMTWRAAGKPGQARQPPDKYYELVLGNDGRFVLGQNFDFTCLFLYERKAPGTVVTRVVTHCNAPLRKTL